MAKRKEINIAFGKRLKTLIFKAGLNNAKLAKKIGVTPGAIGNYINKGRVPESNILIKIAQMFNISMDELLTGINIAKEKTPIIPSPTEIGKYAPTDVWMAWVVRTLEELLEKLMEKGYIDKSDIPDIDWKRIEDSKNLRKKNQMRN